MNQNFRKHLPLLLLFLLGIVWSLGYSIARYCMTHGVSPLGYSFWQSLGPAVALGLLMLFSKTSFGLTQRHLTYYVLTAITGIALPNSVMYFSAGHLPSGLLAIIVNTVPIFTYPLALLAHQERFQIKRLFAVGLGCVGIFWLILSHQPMKSFHDWFNGETPWAFLTLLTPLSFAFCSIFIAHQPKPDTTPLSLSFGMLLCSTLFLTPFVFETHSFYRFHFPLTLTDGLLLTEIGLSTLGYLIFFALLRLSGAVYYSMVGGVVAIAGMLWGNLFFGETFPLIAYLPIFLVLLAILAISHPINHRKPQKPHSLE